MALEVWLWEYFDFGCYVKEIIEEGVGKDWHSVKERIFISLFIECENRGWVVVSYSFSFVKVIIDSIEINMRMIFWFILCKTFIISSEFFAAMTMLRIVIDYFIHTFISNLLVFLTSDCLRPYLCWFLTWEIFLNFSLFALIDPCD